MRHATLAVIAALVLPSCSTNHMKRGDRYAALGEWGNAVTEYERAVRNDEGDEAIAKLKGARGELAGASYREAQACATAGQWECAMAKIDVALKLQPDVAEWRVFRETAAQNLAAGQLTAARADADANRCAEALERIRIIEANTRDPNVLSAAAPLRARCVQALVAESDAFRMKKDYRSALERMERAAGYDPSLEPRLVDLRKEYDAWAMGEQNRLVAEARKLSKERKWEQADQKYREAWDLRKDPAVERKVNYTTNVVRGELANKALNFAAARDAFVAARETGEDADGYAATRQAAAEAALATRRYIK